MKKLIFLFWLLLISPALAQSYGASPSDIPGWVLKPTPAIDCNFALGAYYNCPLDKTFSITRASTKYCQWTSQIWMSVASGAPCITDQGWLIEEARTNLALWSRDMTQSGTWIAVTMTAVLNAVGIDGSANSATTLTSSSAAGTILQSLTAGSAAYTYTVFVKGVTVTGNIQVADYPVLTPAFTTLTSSNCFNPVTGVGTAPVSSQTIFVRCTITATSLNPVIGFKFANNGDSIIVDFNQLEAAAFGTSPILTTSASATRAADAIAGANSLLNLAQGKLYSEHFVATPQSPVGNAANTVLASFDDGTTSNRLVLRRQNTSSNPHIILATSGTVLINADVGGAIPWAQSAQNTFSIASQVSDQQAAYNLLLDTNFYNVAPPSGITNMRLGSSTAGEYWNGLIARATFWNTSIPNGGLLQ